MRRDWPMIGQYPSQASQALALSERIGSFVRHAPNDDGGPNTTHDGTNE